MNNILEEIQSINSLEFQLLNKDLTKLNFDEENKNLLIVHVQLQPILQYEPLDWILTLYLDIEDILSYPIKIITEPIRMNVLHKINPSKWLNNRRIYDNLLNVFNDILNE